MPFASGLRRSRRQPFLHPTSHGHRARRNSYRARKSTVTSWAEISSQTKRAGDLQSFLLWSANKQRPFSENRQLT
ncbi:hypothetical protein ZEAMMB73_Zm00001d002375 [Zea mays]|uniref:Uncharacterized protein n=1 Tax=Zea mays TaxID=4577 RepID=A0A1D6E028_MAIZE|nr:hypothetical protein ZEAMMB73_Zm00001d002375 [Zea mays]